MRRVVDTYDGETEGALTPRGRVGGTYDEETEGALTPRSPAAEEGGGGEQRPDGDHDGDRGHVEVRIDRSTCIKAKNAHSGSYHDMPDCRLVSCGPKF